jgi:betaine-aldehyde dehydrogenase
VLAEVHAADLRDVDEAVAGAVAAAADPSWRDLKPHVRATYLHKVAQLLREDADDIAHLQTLNTGKTLTETRALVASAAATFQFFAAAVETLEGEITPSRGDYITVSVREPIGVVAAITPWNSPIASDAQKIAPALAAGNAVVLKPAEVTPLVALALGRVIERAGVPPGVFSVLPGPGRVLGDALVRHPDIGKVSFTGGTTTGRSIGKIAAEKIMPVSLELGGKSPTMILADADMEQAIAGVLFGIFSSSGQSCVAGSRLFVERSKYDEVIATLVERTKLLRVGPGLDPETQVGPMVTYAHRDSVHSYVELARKEGGRVLCGGGPPEDAALANGAFYLPTIIDGLPNGARVCQEEIFGPVLVVLPFEDDDDLLRQANDSVYGLACGIWTQDYRRAWRIAREVKSGTVWMNTYKQFSISTPFGGVKQSGLGREKGRLGIEAYMQQKSIYVGMTTDALPWAGS